MSDSVRPHRRLPTRLPSPWDSPGKNTGVGCHFLLQRMKVKSESEAVQLCPTPSDPMDCSLPGSSVHGIFQARVLEWGAIAFSRASYSTHKLGGRRNLRDEKLRKGSGLCRGFCCCSIAQSCPTLCDPIDGCPPGSPVPGILQARTLHWVAISFSNAQK